ncbi:MAG: YsnF/AvaK domain-containing protein [Deltaproteobacteria bacterium]|nr:YsnF/AvaK domain-containing protein [Deltaproteobacteria bacterium]
MKTVIAAFPDRGVANQAIGELSSLNIDHSNIRILDGGEANILPQLLAKRVPEDRAHLYCEVLRRGAPLVIVDCDDDDAQRVASILDERGSLDLDSAAGRWRTAGWEGYSEGAQSFDESSAALEREELERESLAVIQEEVRVGKRQVEGGGVRLRAFVTEQPIHETVQLREEHVEVNRERVDEPVPIAPDESTFTEEEYVVTAMSEEPVVQKQARVVERVHVEKTADTRTETIEESERRRDVEVEQLDPRSPRR